MCLDLGAVLRLRRLTLLGLSLNALLRLGAGLFGALLDLALLSLGLRLDPLLGLSPGMLLRLHCLALPGLNLLLGTNLRLAL